MVSPASGQKQSVTGQIQRVQRMGVSRGVGDEVGQGGGGGGGGGEKQQLMASNIAQIQS